MKPNVEMRRMLDALPKKPGCYLMKDITGKVIYVGKAINLRSRVRSYFHSGKDYGRKKRQLVKRLTDIEWIIQESEVEALLLEYNLINRYRPKYNVRWKDDKRYPYIRVHWADQFPKVTVTRHREEDGSRYFGPYTSVRDVHRTLDVLRKIFPYLTCDRIITGNDQRACLYWDINLCEAPCIGACSQEEYRSIMGDMCQFLQGNTNSVVYRLKKEMNTASTMMEYERAATTRDQLIAIKRIVEKQKVISTRRTDADVIAFDRDDDNACVQVFLIREGKLIGRDHFMLEGTSGEDEATILTAFLKHFYHKSAYVPPEILLPQEASEAQILERWLRELRGGRKVTLNVPKRGGKRELVQMATENASEALATLNAQYKNYNDQKNSGLAELRVALSLPMPPNRIECYDVSNTQGTYATGSMVVFRQGKPAKSHYRRFTIRTVSGPDDYASMREVLTRRFSRWSGKPTFSSDKHERSTKQDQSFSQLPDLIIVDGGKAHLEVVIGVMDEFGISERLQVAALAKKDEGIYRPGKAIPILLSQRSPGLFLLQRIRDEAHRFALSHHRMLRRRSGLKSQLESVPGIGPARRKALLIKFGSMNGIRSASFDDLLQVRGMSATAVQSLKDTL